MLVEGLAVAVESLVNRHVGESSAARDALASLSGRSLAVYLEGIGITVRLDAGESVLRIRIHRGRCLEDADATVSAAPLVLFALVRNPGSADLRDSAAAVDGDPETAEAFAEVLRLASPDLEEELSRLVGDIAAHGMSSAARQAAAWGERAFQALVMNTSEFLQEEARELPPRSEVRQFIREVDGLREDVDRASQRIDLLVRASSGSAECDGSD